MKMLLAIAGAVALAVVAAGCTDNATAPNALSPDLAMVSDGQRVIEYVANCELKYEEFENPGNPEGAMLPRERIIGKGGCNVRPLGKAEVVLEGWATYPNGRYLIEGQLFYLFRDGSRLASNARMAESEMWSQTVTTPFDFGQHFLKGTGRLAAVTGGQGYGDGRIHQMQHIAIYQATGRILLGAQ